MPTKKIADLPNKRGYQDPEHKPPMYQVFEPGIYEHICPSCGKVTRFTVDHPPELKEFNDDEAYDDESPDYIRNTEDGI